MWEKFGRRFSVKNHIQVVHEGKGFECDKCGKVFGHNSHLKTHIQVIHEGKRFKFKLCSSDFRARKSLRTHMNNVHGGYKCPQCSESFNRRLLLEEHKFNKCSPRTEDVGNDKNDKPSSHHNSCQYCDKDSIKPGVLNEHLAKYHSGDPDVCSSEQMCAFDEIFFCIQRSLLDEENSASKSHNGMF